MYTVSQALLRPGFLEQVIHVDLPDFETRCDIWRGVLEGVPQEGIMDIAKLSEATIGYSGAEVSIVLVPTSILLWFSLFSVLVFLYSSYASLIRIYGHGYGFICQRMHPVKQKNIFS